MAINQATLCDALAMADILEWQANACTPEQSALAHSLRRGAEVIRLLQAKHARLAAVAREVIEVDSKAAAAVRMLGLDPNCEAMKLSNKLRDAL